MTERQSLMAIVAGLLLIAAGLAIDAALPFPTELIGDVVAAGGGVVLTLGVVLKRERR